MTDFSSPRSRLSRPLTTRGDADRVHPELARNVEAGLPVRNPVPDPGLPDAGPRLTDVEPRARQRAKRQVAGVFAVAAVLVIASVVFYFGFMDEAGGDDVNVGDLQVSNLMLGLTLGLAVLLAGVGVVHWSRVLMTGTEVVEHRSEDDGGGSTQQGSGGGVKSPTFGRRRLIRNSLLGALALLPLPAVWALRGLDPIPGNKRGHTAWAKGVRLLTDVSYRPIRVSDVQVGEMVSVMPASFLDLPEDGPARMNERAKSPVVLVRMRPDDLAPAEGRENWHVDGIVAYSKICTHLGCPVSLYERTTHHLLCPCHQATFDLADNGTVVFGPATRSLPQLSLAVDDDGFLVAQSDFTEAVGPSYWEREA
jgi:ubiquinol-cytochrome c reductase iron-sulfur subunit